ncbi:MAG: phosphonate ABC transporter ATP-binding protein [Flavobacteriaceae bacterium]|nr:phosphonate ABC transporter ATP-binding protein [Flavobacteriaceae bacterium]|tara:strand:+ start:214 stop:906 length:693 start_codon:yes stop_codon:yes gene_type:complete
MINVNNLKKVYRTDEIETTSLNDINFKIDEGEFVAVMGPSGCGKSTLLNILGLLDKPTSGDYEFNGVMASSLGGKQRTLLLKGNIGFIFQSFNLIDDLTVFENVELPLLYQKVPKSERKQKVEEILKKVDILHRKNHFPNQLSGGQQQRVAVARAIVSEPKLILADEPTGNLDSENGNDVIEIIKKLNEEGATIVMVTHSNHDASFAKRIIRLFDGKIVEDSINEKVLAN